MDTLDIPQANDLESVRSVLAAIAHGAGTVDEILERTGYSRRHVQYRVHAARVLGLCRIEPEGAFIVAPPGERLLLTRPGSHDERAAFARAIEQSPELRVFAPDLLGPAAPRADELAERMMAVANLSPATAVHRAEGLLTWRRRVLDEVLPTAAPPPAAPPPPVEPEQLRLFE